MSGMAEQFKEAVLKIDHEYTDEIVCPYCGYEFMDSWEFRPESDIIRCYECDKAFEYERIIDVTYCTTKKDEA